MHIKKISFFSKEKLNNSAVKALKEYGFKYSSKPDLIICFGGDGTLLLAEHLFPGIPKIPIHHKSICKKCSSFNVHHVLKHVKEGSYYTETIKKIKVFFNKKRIEALNDIIIRNKHQYAALRFSLEIDGKKLGNFIGDGIAASTSFGSTAYFYSITGERFNNGFAVALNNIHSDKKYPPIFFKKQVILRVLREKCIISADNNRKTLEASKGDSIKIYPGREANLLHLHNMTKSK